MDDLDLNRAVAADRELDKQVALALGYTLYMTNVHPNGWGLWDGVSDDVYIDDRPRGYGKTWLPRYSAPRTAGDRASLLECVMWLASRGIGISIESDGVHVGPILTNIDGSGVWVVSVPGTDMAAFALAVSRAVVRA